MKITLETPKTFVDMANLLAAYAESIPKCCDGNCFMELFEAPLNRVESLEFENERRFVELLNSPDWQGFDVKSALKLWLATYSEHSGMSFGDFVGVVQ